MWGRDSSHPRRPSVEILLLIFKPFIMELYQKNSSTSKIINPIHIIKIPSHSQITLDKSRMNMH